jgi:hypothetical protein
VFFQGNPDDKNTLLTQSAPVSGGGGAQAPTSQGYTLFNGSWTPFESVVKTLRQPDQTTQYLAADRLRRLMEPQKPKLYYNYTQPAYAPDTSRFTPNVDIPQNASWWVRQKMLDDARRKGTLQYTYKPTEGDVLAASLAEDDPTRQSYLRHLQRQAIGDRPFTQQNLQAIKTDDRWRGLYEWALQNNPSVARLYEQAFGFSKPAPVTPPDQQWV